MRVPWVTVVGRGGGRGGAALTKQRRDGKCTSSAHRPTGGDEPQNTASALRGMTITPLYTCMKKVTSAYDCCEMILYHEQTMKTSTSLRNELPSTVPCE